MGRTPAVHYASRATLPGPQAQYIWQLSKSGEFNCLEGGGHKSSFSTLTHHSSSWANWHWMSIDAAKLRSIRGAQSGLASKVACPTTLMLEDCDASIEDTEKPLPSDQWQWIRNRNGGKLHRALLFGDTFHPREWKTRCAWHFRGPHTLFEALRELPDNPSYCFKCFPEQKESRTSSDSSSNSDSGSSSSA